MTRYHEELFHATATLIYSKTITRTYPVTGTGEAWRHMGVFLDDAKARGAIKDWAAPMSTPVQEAEEEDQTPEEIESFIRLLELIDASYPAYQWLTNVTFECRTCGKDFEAYQGDFEFSPPTCAECEEGRQ